MKNSSACALVLLTVSSLACDAPVDDASLRALDGFAPPLDASLRFGSSAAAQPVLEHGLGANLDLAIEDPQSSFRHGATLEVDDGALLALVTDGLNALGQVSDDVVSFTLRSGEEALAFDARPSRFSIRLDPDGRATTEVTFADDGQSASPDDLVWVDDSSPAVASPAVVTEIRYELVSRSGRRTTCRATDLMGADSMDFARLSDGRSDVEIEIADGCAHVLEAAAASEANDAFFVVCDGTTVTAGVAVHGASDVTLKRGIFRAAGTVSTGVLVHDG